MMIRVLSRRSLVQAGAGIVGAAMLPGCSQAATSAERTVSLPDFRRPGDLDDTEALHRAISERLPIYAPAGKGSGPDGVYQLATGAPLDIRSGFTLFGDGIDKTIIARSYARKAPFILHVDSGSADVAHNLADVHLHDLSFSDDVAKRGFSQFDYLVMLNGVTDAIVERVAFRGFRGDGLYVGSSTTKAFERHNHNVTVRDCLFDGVNANNRNGISILDCDGLVVERCSFINVTRGGGAGPEDPMDPKSGPPMPGAIDFEPDENDFAVVRNITIRENRFDGGGGYAVSLSLRPNNLLRIAQRTFRIERNIVSNRAGGFSASGFGSNDAITDGRSYAITITGNKINGCGKPFLINGIRGLTLSDNGFVDCLTMGELGYDAAIADITLDHNEFLRCGTTQGYAIWVRTVDGLRITNNSFIDCGLADKSLGVSIGLVLGRIVNVSLTGNKFASPTGRTTEPLTVFRDARVDRGTVDAARNVVDLGRQSVGASLGF